MREFLLPSDVVRGADNPDEAPLAFLRSTYDAAAGRGGWEPAGRDRAPEAWP